MYGKNVKFSNLVSLVALGICFGLQDNLDAHAPFMHLFYLILHHVNLEEWPELERKLYMPSRLYIVSCNILILHYNGLLRSPSAPRFDQSIIKGNWKWHTFIEVRLKWIFIPYWNEFPYLINLGNQKVKCKHW